MPKRKNPAHPQKKAYLVKSNYSIIPIKSLKMTVIFVLVILVAFLPDLHENWQSFIFALSLL